LATSNFFRDLFDLFDNRIKLDKNDKFNQYDEKNLKRRAKCFEIARQKNVQPIQIALAYVLHKSSLIFPLIGPRTIFETNSSIEATQINLSDKELSELAIE
jgi:aryl-alcohol dehydrogenase-like predicted oxidoreductase